jgi:hypothetical protein
MDAMNRPGAHAARARPIRRATVPVMTQYCQQTFRALLRRVHRSPALRLRRICTAFAPRFEVAKADHFDINTAVVVLKWNKGFRS